MRVGLEDVGRKGRLGKLITGFVIVWLVGMVLSGCGDSTATSIPAATIALPTTSPAKAATTAIPTAANSIPPSLAAKQTAAANLTVTALAAPTATPTPLSSNEAHPCLASDLVGEARAIGATGSMAIGINLTNNGKSVCSLQGRPEVQLLNGQGKPLPVEYRTFCRECAEGYVTRAPAVATQTVTAYFNPLIDLQPGQQATIPTIWNNWCGPAPDSIKLKITLPGQQGILTVVPDYRVPPRCDASDAKSSFSVGPFEKWQP